MDAPPQDCEVDSSGNQSCLECGKDDPEWIIVEPGVGICPDCSGVHRSLSVDKPVKQERAENMAESAPPTDPDIELPSSSDDVVPPAEPASSDDEEYDESQYGEAALASYVPMSLKRPMSLGEDTIDLIARNFWTPRPLRSDEDPETMHKLFYEHLRAIPKHERVLFLHKIDGLCNQYFGNKRF